MSLVSRRSYETGFIVCSCSFFGWCFVQHFVSAEEVVTLVLDELVVVCLSIVAGSGLSGFEIHFIEFIFVKKILGMVGDFGLLSSPSVSSRTRSHTLTFVSGSAF